MSEKKEINLNMPDRILARLARISILAEQPIETVINVLLAAVVEEAPSVMKVAPTNEDA